MKPMGDWDSDFLLELGIRYLVISSVGMIKMQLMYCSYVIERVVIVELS